MEVAQTDQKRRYDQSQENAPFLICDRFRLSKMLARLWKVPYRIIKLVDTKSWLRNIGSDVELKFGHRLKVPEVRDRKSSQTEKHWPWSPERD
jgi:hypothetical protein